jgi:nitrate reductase gamma subunit
MPTRVPTITAVPAYRLLADLVVGVHVAFVVFVVLGGLLVLRWPWVAGLHLPAAAWGVLIEFAGWICPLTPLEQSLRQRAGTQGYSGSFIEHYMLPLLYPSALTRNIQLVLGSAVLVLNLGIYAYLLRRAGGSPSSPRGRIARSESRRSP